MNRKGEALGAIAVISLASILVMMALTLSTKGAPVEQDASQWNETSKTMCPDNVPIVGKWIVYGEPVYMEVIAAGDKFYENRSSGTTVVTFEHPPEYWSYAPGNTGVDAGD